MTKRAHLESDLPDLDRAGDPRGGAAGWALLAVGVALIAGIVIAVLGSAGAW